MSRGSLAIAVLLTGCPAPFPQPESATMLDATTSAPQADDDGDGSSVDGDGDDGASSAGQGGSTSSTSSDGDDATSKGPSTSDPSTGNPDDTTGGMVCVGPTLPGFACVDHCECATGHCAEFAPVLGNICGDCSTDADCIEGGCSFPNPFAKPPEGTTCNSGDLGGGCKSDRACQNGLVCAPILDVSGIFEISTCSQCVADGDCGPLLCAPAIDFPTWSLTKVCIAPGSLAIGLSCDHLGSGDAACQSGDCAPANFMGVLEIGVCSECDDSGDCMGGDTCEAAVVEANGALTPAHCQTPK